MTKADEKPLVAIKELSKHFKMGRKTVIAVNNLTLSIKKGETLGLVGESGCGKSTVGRALVRLLEPTSGQLLFDGDDITRWTRYQLLPFRRRAQMIFQDPYSSLNPRLTVEEIVGEALDIHRLATGEKRLNRIEELLELVGLSRQHMGRYPHEFSGGQRQRIGIARALAVSPEFLVCDEPLSALDVSVQAQVVNLLKSLQERLALTYLFIAHDLSMVEYLSHRVAVMYLGNLMELAPTPALFSSPKHPYTQALLSAVPIPDPQLERRRSRIVLTGEVPSAAAPPSGCVFRTRCPKAMPICASVKPEWTKVGQDHFVSCHLYNIGSTTSTSAKSR